MPPGHQVAHRPVIAGAQRSLGQASHPAQPLERRFRAYAAAPVSRERDLEPSVDRVALPKRLPISSCSRPHARPAASSKSLVATPIVMTLVGQSGLTLDATPAEPTPDLALVLVRQPALAARTLLEVQNLISADTKLQLTYTCCLWREFNLLDNRARPHTSNRRESTS